MTKDINSLKVRSQQKAEDLNIGVEKYGVDYLIKVNTEVNEMYKQKGFKTKDYKELMEEQQNDSDDKE